MTKVIDKIEGFMGNCEYIGQKYPEILAFPLKRPNGPSLGTKQANHTGGSSTLGQQQDQPLILNSHVTHGPQLTDISNQQHTKHDSYALGSKWSRILHSSSGSKEALLSHAGQKRGFVVDFNQLELPNKKFRVSQDDKENARNMAEAGSQPCQEL